MRRALVVLHRWLGLFSALFLALAGLTGAVIAWDHELDAWLNPELYYSDSRGEPLPALALADKLERSDSRLVVRYLSLAHEPGHSQLLSVDPRIDQTTGQPFALDFDQVALDPVDGTVQGKRMWGAASLSRENLLPFLYKLHYSLHLPEVGGTQLGVLFMGIVACAWFLDAFIALWISFPNLDSWRKSFAFRVRAGGYRLIFDLHRSGGVWIWPLLLVLSLSAVAMNLEDQVVRPVVGLFSALAPEPFEGREASQARAPAPLPREQILSLARAEAARRAIEAPLGGIFYVRQFGAYGVGFFEPGNEHGDGSLGNPWLYFDAATGAPLGGNVPGTGSAGDVFLQLQFPLHSGRIGGVAGRILVSLLGLLVAGLSVTGIVIWARKRGARERATVKRGERPAPEPLSTLAPHSNLSHPGDARQ